jgi:hypothetical protein
MVEKQDTKNSFVLSETPKNNFEGELFRNGTLDFNIEKYVAKTTKYLTDIKQWINDNPNWDEKTFATISKSYDHELVWLQRFSGKIPKHWGKWYNVRYDFEKARKQCLPLSRTLVDAGISNPCHLVTIEVGKGQRLNARQMAWVFVRPEIPMCDRNEIIKLQKQNGLSDKDMETARKMADEIHERMRGENTQYTLST